MICITKGNIDVPEVKMRRVRNQASQWIVVSICRLLLCLNKVCVYCSTKNTFRVIKRALYSLWSLWPGNLIWKLMFTWEQVMCEACLTVIFWNNIGQINVDPTNNSKLSMHGCIVPTLREYMENQAATIVTVLQKLAKTFCWCPMENKFTTTHCSHPLKTKLKENSLGHFSGQGFFVVIVVSHNNLRSDRLAKLWWISPIRTMINQSIL